MVQRVGAYRRKTGDCLNLSDNSYLGSPKSRLDKFKAGDEVRLWGERYEILNIYENKVEIRQLGEWACVIADYVPNDVFLSSAKKVYR